jgi:hypothetical protein
VRVTGRQDQGGCLNTSCDQQAALRLDAGMRSVLVGRVYRLAAHCIEGVAGGSGCKEYCSKNEWGTDHRERLAGVETALPVLPWRPSHRRRPRVSLQLQFKCLTLATQRRTGERICLMPVRRCTWRATPYNGPAHSRARDGYHLVASRVPTSGLE